MTLSRYLKNAPFGLKKSLNREHEHANYGEEVSRSRRTAVQRTLMARIDTSNTRAARVGRRGIGEPVSQYALMPRDWRA